MLPTAQHIPQRTVRRVAQPLHAMHSICLVTRALRRRARPHRVRKAMHVRRLPQPRVPNVQSPSRRIRANRVSIRKRRLSRHRLPRLLMRQGHSSTMSKETRMLNDVMPTDSSPKDRVQAEHRNRHRIIPDSRAATAMRRHLAGMPRVRPVQATIPSAAVRA